MISTLRFRCVALGFVVIAALSVGGHSESLSADQIADLRARIRNNFFVPDPLPPLNAMTVRRFEPAPDVKAEAVTYATQFGTRIPAILYLPNPLPAGKIPAFIVVNGHGGGKYSWYSFFTGITYARAGAAVLTYDQAGEGERNSNRKSGIRDCDHPKGGGEVMVRRLCGLMLTDVMQGVSYLASRPEVDAGRIGAGGYSLGSFVLAVTGDVEPRLRACVIVGGGNLDSPSGNWDLSRPIFRSMDFLTDRSAAVYAMHAARGPTLLVNGSQDTAVNIDQTPQPSFEDMRARTIQLRGSADGVFEIGFVSGGRNRPYFLTRPAALWLKRQLNFPNWSDDYIAKMPETHISEWAIAHRILMDNFNAIEEEREGGLHAVGEDIPGYQREDLSVYSPQEWEVHKPKLSFETWNAAALALSKPKG
jgi:dienelactone hydrolase